MPSSATSSLDPTTGNTGPPPQPDRQAAKLFFALTLVYVAFILFASFSFGGSKPFSFFEGLKHLSTTPDSFQRLRFHDLRDISTNILLYMPLGCVVAFWLATLKSLRLTTPWLLFGPAISISAEFTQFFINRYPDPVDVVTNTAGYVTGFTLTLWAIRKYRFEVTALLGIGQTVSTNVRTLQVIRFLYVGVYIIVQLLPLNISVSLTQLYGQLAAPPGGSPQIILDPFFHFHSDSMTWHSIFLEFLGMLPLGVLSGTIYRLRARLSPLGPPLFCLILVLCVETAKLFVLSATTDVLHLALALFAGLVGSLIVTVKSDLPRRYGFQAEPSEAPKTAALLGILYSFFLLLYALSPYDFEPDLRRIVLKLQQDVNWIPFYAHLSARNIHSAVDIVREVLLYTPLGVLISLARRRPWTRLQSVAISFMTGLFMGAFNELAQTVVAHRVVDVTDTLLASLGCAAGAWVGFVFRNRDIRRKA